ncbi:hypothetical protein T4E_5077 [Trichinella pseudospiralis]|uniref:Uncharacterized protein n=1 Tax=Trichinella pseudospiralis TaxID=6337 RepID=A0A0V0XQ06_TRIPS|nr:hypothetical protein T4E_5077 [Trichinella pseudospiralis]
MKSVHPAGCSVTSFRIAVERDAAFSSVILALVDHVVWEILICFDWQTSDAFSGPPFSTYCRRADV